MAEETKTAEQTAPETAETKVPEVAKTAAEKTAEKKNFLKTLLSESVTKEKRMGHIIKMVVFLLLFLIIVNPGGIKFLPYGVRDTLTNAWSRVFGDVSQVVSTISINWVSLFQIIAILLFLNILYNVFKFILERVKPKTNKGKSIVSMLTSYSFYAAVLVGIIWCLNAIGINLSAIFASIGVVALVIGFAAESLIEDIITGIFLTFEDDFNVGDIIEYNGFRANQKSPRPLRPGAYQSPV